MCCCGSDGWPPPPLVERCQRTVAGIRPPEHYQRVHGGRPAVQVRAPKGIPRPWVGRSRPVCPIRRMHHLRARRIGAPEALAHTPSRRTRASDHGGTRERVGGLSGEIDPNTTLKNQRINDASLDPEDEFDKLGAPANRVLNTGSPDLNAILRFIRSFNASGRSTPNRGKRGTHAVATPSTGCGMLWTMVPRYVTTSVFHQGNAVYIADLYHRHSGKVSRKVVPSPTVLFTSMCTPWALRMVRALVSPSPMPPVRPE